MATQIAPTSAPSLSIPARIRQGLGNAPALTRALQAGRALFHFGPWRHAARAIIRRSRPPLTGSGLSRIEGLQLNAPQIARTLRADSIAITDPLPSALLERLLELTKELPPGEYGQFHDDADVHTLVLGDDVLDVVREFLGAEPELLECTLVVHRTEDPTELPISPQRHFHFDYAGWQSLNLFVYLTDVDDKSGSHQVVVGTHRNRKIRDAVRTWVPDDEIMERYGAQLRTVAGPAGTMFFENTEAFHRRLMMKRRRVMLNVLYASHRSWMSNGRLIPTYTDYLRSQAAARR